MMLYHFMDTNHSDIKGLFCISGDLLENYCKNDDLMNAARFGFAITIMLTYPIECFVTREVSKFICSHNHLIACFETREFH